MAGLAMTRDDIIRMAREAGLEAYSILPHKEIDWDCLVDDLATFAALVAAAERKAIWDMLFEYAGRDDLSDSDQSLLKHLADLIRARSNP